MSPLFQGAHLSVVTFVALYMTKEWPQTIRATWENVVYTHIVKDVTIGVECQGRLREVVARDFEGFPDWERDARTGKYGSQSPGTAWGRR